MHTTDPNADAKLMSVGSTEWLSRSQAEEFYRQGIEMDASHPIHGWVDAGVKTSRAVGLLLWGGPATVYKLKRDNEPNSAASSRTER